MIATNRISSEGGSFKGSEEARINILYECCDLVDYVDIELQSDDEYINKIHDTGVTTIVSYHDFNPSHILTFFNLRFTIVLYIYLNYIPKVLRL